LGYNVTAFYGWSYDKDIKIPQAAGVIGTILDRTGKSDDGGYFGYESLGLIRTQAQAQAIINERAAAAGGAQNVKILGYTPAPGMINYADLNGDGVITADNQDQKYLTNKANNHNNAGLNFGFNYKGISLSVVSGFSWGGVLTIPNGDLFGTYTSSGKLDLDQNRTALWNEGYWTPQTPNAKLPAPYYTMDYGVPSNFFMYSGFTWNISQINLGYSLPVNLIKHVGLANARLFVQCSNALNLINPYPEHYRALGSSTAVYPALRTISVGLNAGF